MGLRAIDIGVLLACALAIFLALRADGYVGYVHIWHYPLEQPASSPSGTGIDAGPGPGPPSPLAEQSAAVGPLVRDLNGDGAPEVIVVTVTPKPALRVLQIRVHGSQAEAEDRQAEGSARPGIKGFEHQDRSKRFDRVSSVDPEWASVMLSAEAEIIPELRVGKGRVPLAVQSGYTERYSEDVSRTQVIVVVTDGCKVLCYSSKLKLLWQSAIQCELENHRLADVAILISSEAVYKGDSGMVVVGARSDPIEPLEHGSPKPADLDDLDEGLDDEDDSDEGGGDAGGKDPILKTRQHRGEAMNDLAEGHYSYYCFEGRTGEPRWSHTGNEFAPEINPAENVAPITRVNVHEDMGELNWQAFRSSFVESLPHAWFRPEDTSLSLAHFAKRRSGKSRVEKQKQREVDAGHLEHQLPGSGFGEVDHLLRPHLESEHIKRPNIIVAKLRGGIQAIHLFTGKQVAQVSLQPTGAHADVNADGVIDHVEAIAGWVTPWLDSRGIMEKVQKHIPPSLPRCLVLVTSGIPPQSRLFNNTICPKRLRGRSRRNYEMRFTQEDEQKVTVTRPVLILKHSSKPKNRARSSSSRGGKQYDMIFVASTGHVTSIAPDGKRNWQVLTESGWDFKHDSLGKRKEFLPYAIALPTRDEGHDSHDTETNILVVGDRTATVLSSRGSVRSKMDLTGIPIGPPVLGDFSGDGFTDIILRTESGLDGYVSRRRISTALITVIVGGLVVALTLALVFTLTSDI